MPLDSASLVGFMQRTQAVDYLRNQTTLANKTDIALEARWSAANAILGPSVANAGFPDIQDMPSAAIAPYFKQPKCIRGSHKPSRASRGLSNWSASERYSRINFMSGPASRSSIARPSRASRLFRSCWPSAFRSPRIFEADIAVNQGETGSVTISSKSLNTRVLETGWFGINLPEQTGFAGIACGESSPFVQVARFNGRCYLKNGFRRVYGLGAAGATHIPCIFVDEIDPLSVGIRGANQTFDLPILESADPPTCSHFIDGKATMLPIRRFERHHHRHLVGVGVSG